MSRTLFCSLLLLFGCQNEPKDINLDDLNSIKRDFLCSIFEGQTDESPFHMGYNLRTVFFSKDVVSLLGEIHIYDHLPHGSMRFEGKTLCKIHGKLQEITLDDLFTTVRQKEFLRKYCEDQLKSMPNSYFYGEDSLRTTLDYGDIHNFVVDDKFLILFFPPYHVGGLDDGPLHIKIPYEVMRSLWNEANSLWPVLREAIASRAYTASWNEEWTHQKRVAE